MNLEWPEPEPEPLDWLYPTSIEAMRACPRRLAYHRDPRTRSWDRGGSRTSLGIVAHQLTELVMAGRAPAADRRPWLEEKWIELLAAQHAILVNEWRGSVVPQPATWPGMLATRVRLLRTLEKTVATGAGELSAAADLGDPPLKPLDHGDSSELMPGPLPWVEQQLFDSSTRLAGRPDRVDETDGRLRLVDLKAGVGQTEVTAAQRRQMLLYAHLVRVQAGRLPDDILIVDVRGVETRIDASAAEVDETVEAGISALAGFRERTAAQAFPGSPSPEACRWCPFRVVCADYWSDRGADWLMIDVCGVVIEAGDTSTTIQEPGDEGRRVRVIGSSARRAVLGDEMVAVDLERAGAGAGRLRWWSRVRFGGTQSDVFGERTG